MVVVIGLSGGSGGRLELFDLALIISPNLALESPTMYYNLGVLYLSSVAKEAGFSVMVSDMRMGMRTVPLSHFVGFSCTTPEITFAKELSAMARASGRKTIVGGSHPSLLPEDCLGHFNYIVIGEGEEVLPSILAGKRSEGIILSSRLSNLDIIPLPDWDTIQDPFSGYPYAGERYGESPLSASIITSRGCPFHCSFCGNMLRTPVVYRSPASVESEIIALLQRGVTHYRFVDDNFTLNPDFLNMCLVLSRYPIRYRCHTRANILTEDKVIGLKGSGCDECALGVESADNNVLQLSNKGETAETNREAIQMLKEAGLRVKVYLMSGLPGETDKSIELTKEFIGECKPDRWTLSTFTPYPGCDIWDNPDKYGIEIINPNWENWWNFVIPIAGKTLPGRAGFVHRLKGQTVTEMENRHNNLLQWLKEESWLH